MPKHIQPVHTLSEEDVTQLNILMASRDGLLGMYPKLLIEKEQRLRNFMSLHQSDMLDHHIIRGSRSWKLVMALHRIRYRLARIFGPAK